MKVPNDRGHCRGRPPQVWSMVIITVVGSLLCLVGVIWPATDASPVRLDAVLAVLGLAIASLLWWSRPSIQHPLLHAAGIVYLMATTAIVAKAATGEGAISTAVSYIWISMYATVFFSRFTARIYVAASGIALAIGIHLNSSIVSGFAAWLVVVITVAVAVEMLSWLLERMSTMATTDDLTGLPNRAALEDALRRERAVTARTGDPLTLAVIDLNDFKKVNDHDGHVAGDRLLIALAKEWRDNIRPRDLLFRYGGDEFVLLLPNTSEDDARALLDRLQSNSRGSWSYGAGQVEVNDELEASLARADHLMYKQKGA